MKAWTLFRTRGVRAAHLMLADLDVVLARGQCPSASTGTTYWTLVGRGRSTVRAYRPHGQGCGVSSTNSEAASANDCLIYVHRSPRAPRERRTALK
jgi:hypothetical protein